MEQKILYRSKFGIILAHRKMFPCKANYADYDIIKEDNAKYKHICNSFHTALAKNDNTLSHVNSILNHKISRLKRILTMPIKPKPTLDKRNLIHFDIRFTHY